MWRDAEIDEKILRSSWRTLELSQLFNIINHQSFHYIRIQRTKSIFLLLFNDIIADMLNTWTIFIGLCHDQLRSHIDPKEIPSNLFVDNIQEQSSSFPDYPVYIESRSEVDLCHKERNRQWSDSIVLFDR